MPDDLKASRLEPAPGSTYEGKTVAQWIHIGLQGGHVPDEVRRHWWNGVVGREIEARRAEGRDWSKEPAPAGNPAAVQAFEAMTEVHRDRDEKERRKARLVAQETSARTAKDLDKRQRSEAFAIAREQKRVAKAVKAGALGRRELRNARSTPLSRFMSDQLRAMQQVPGEFQVGRPAILARTLKAKWDASRHIPGWRPTSQEYFEGVVTQLQRNAEARRRLFRTKEFDVELHPAQFPLAVSGRNIKERRAEASTANNRKDQQRRAWLFSQRFQRRKHRRELKQIPEESPARPESPEQPEPVESTRSTRWTRLGTARLYGRGLVSSLRLAWSAPAYTSSLPLLGRIVLRIPGLIPAAAVCWLLISFVNVIWVTQSQGVPAATYWWHAAAALVSALLNMGVAILNAILYGISATLKVFLAALFEIITQILELALGSLYAAVNKLIEVTHLGTGTLGPPRLNSDMAAGTWVHLNYYEPGTISTCGDDFIEVVGCQPPAEVTPPEPGGVFDDGSTIQWNSWTWVTSTWDSLWQLAGQVGQRAEDAWSWLTGGTA